MQDTVISKVINLGNLWQTKQFRHISKTRAESIQCSREPGELKPSNHSEAGIVEYFDISH